MTEDQYIAEITRLRNLVVQGYRVVDDFMPNVGKCVLQDYGRLNQFMIDAGKIKNEIHGNGRQRS